MDKSNLVLILTITFVSLLVTYIFIRIIYSIQATIESKNLTTDRVNKTTFLASLVILLLSSLTILLTHQQTEITPVDESPQIYINKIPNITNDLTQELSPVSEHNFVNVSKKHQLLTHYLTSEPVSRPPRGNYNVAEIPSIAAYNRKNHSLIRNSIYSPHLSQFITYLEALAQEEKQTTAFITYAKELKLSKKIFTDSTTYSLVASQNSADVLVLDAKGMPLFLNNKPVMYVQVIDVPFTQAEILELMLEPPYVKFEKPSPEKYLGNSNSAVITIPEKDKLQIIRKWADTYYVSGRNYELFAVLQEALTNNKMSEFFLTRYGVTTNLIQHYLKKQAADMVLFNAFKDNTSSLAQKINANNPVTAILNTNDIDDKLVEAYHNKIEEIENVPELVTTIHKGQNILHLFDRKIDTLALVEAVRQREANHPSYLIVGANAVLTPNFEKEHSYVIFASYAPHNSHNYSSTNIVGVLGLPSTNGVKVQGIPTNIGTFFNNDAFMTVQQKCDPDFFTVPRPRTTSYLPKTTTEQIVDSVFRSLRNGSIDDVSHVPIKYGLCTYYYKNILLLEPQIDDQGETIEDALAAERKIITDTISQNISNERSRIRNKRLALEAAANIVEPENTVVGGVAVDNILTEVEHPHSDPVTEPLGADLLQEVRSGMELGNYVGDSVAAPIAEPIIDDIDDIEFAKLRNIIYTDDNNNNVPFEDDSELTSERISTQISQSIDNQISERISNDIFHEGQPEVVSTSDVNFPEEVGKLRILLSGNDEISSNSEYPSDVDEGTFQNAFNINIASDSNPNEKQQEINHLRVRDSSLKEEQGEEEQENIIYIKQKEEQRISDDDYLSQLIVDNRRKVVSKMEETSSSEDEVMSPELAKSLEMIAKLEAENDDAYQRDLAEAIKASEAVVDDQLTHQRQLEEDELFRLLREYNEFLENREKSHFDTIEYQETSFNLNISTKKAKLFLLRSYEAYLNDTLLNGTLTSTFKRKAIANYIAYLHEDESPKFIREEAQIMRETIEKDTMKRITSLAFNTSFLPDKELINRIRANINNITELQGTFKANLVEEQLQAFKTQHIRKANSEAKILIEKLDQSNFELTLKSFLETTLKGSNHTDIEKVHALLQTAEKLKQEARESAAFDKQQKAVILAQYNSELTEVFGEAVDKWLVTTKRKVPKGLLMVAEKGFLEINAESFLDEYSNSIVMHKYKTLIDSEVQRIFGPSVFNNPVFVNRSNQTIFHGTMDNNILMGPFTFMDSRPFGNYFEQDPRTVVPTPDIVLNFEKLNPRPVSKKLNGDQLRHVFKQVLRLSTSDFERWSERFSLDQSEVQFWLEANELDSFNRVCSTRNLRRTYGVWRSFHSYYIHDLYGIRIPFTIPPGSYNSDVKE